MHSPTPHISGSWPTLRGSRGALYNSATCRKLPLCARKLIVSAARVILHMCPSWCIAETWSLQPKTTPHAPPPSHRGFDSVFLSSVKDKNPNFDVRSTLFVDPVFFFFPLVIPPRTLEQILKSFLWQSQTQEIAYGAWSITGSVITQLLVTTLNSISC